VLVPWYFDAACSSGERHDARAVKDIAAQLDRISAGNMTHRCGCEGSAEAAMNWNGDRKIPSRHNCAAYTKFSGTCAKT